MSTRYGSIKWAKAELKLEILEIKGMPGCPCIILREQSTGEYYPIAAKSWHNGFNGLITCPSTGNYRDSWLADCFGGRVITYAWLRREISQWIEAHETEITALLDDPNQSPDILFATLEF